MKHFYLIALLCMLAVSCAGDKVFRPVSELVVIQAYLHAGLSVDDVRLSTTLPLGSTDSTAPGIKDAQVQLVKNDTCFLLLPSFMRDGYYQYEPDNCPDCLPGQELTVNAGDRFYLEVLYYGKVARAETVVPDDITGLELDTQVLHVNPDSYPGGEEPPSGAMVEDPNTALTVSWDDDGRSMYYVHIKVRGDYSTPIVPVDVIRRAPELSSSLVAGGSYPIGWSNITRYGEYDLTVYRVNREYVEFYTSRNQDTRALNEPASNVENGLGIFTAMNSARATFTVTQGQ